MHGETPKEESRWWKIRHAIAVFIGYFRRPGRFSLIHYSRERAVKYLEEARNGLVLNVGSGGKKVADFMIEVDLKPEKNVDIVADASALPFANESCAGIWMLALLEHVKSSAQVVAEAYRVLKPGGWLYVEVPFICGFHPTPGDYWRWSLQGLPLLFESWTIEWLEPTAGPFSALAYHLRACLSIATSFGSDLWYRVLFEAIWGYVVWPIKWLDYCFRNHPQSLGHSFAYAIMVRKGG